jgi:hypothetical protein
MFRRVQVVMKMKTGDGCSERVQTVMKGANTCSASLSVRYL